MTQKKPTLVPIGIWRHQYGISADRASRIARSGRIIGCIAMIGKNGGVIAYLCPENASDPRKKTGRPPVSFRTNQEGK